MGIGGGGVAADHARLRAQVWPEDFPASVIPQSVAAWEAEGVRYGPGGSCQRFFRTGIENPRSPDGIQ